jgi:hypothetical protein
LGLISIELPIPYYKKNSKALMSLNIYRNLHHHLLNNFKRDYGDSIKALLKDIDTINEPISLAYEFHFIGKKRVDIANIGTIVDKVFSDCLVEVGIIKDDSSEFVRKVSFIGSNGHSEMKCFVTIKEMV